MVLDYLILIPQIQQSVPTLGSLCDSFHNKPFMCAYVVF
ncbi:MAG: hypothetical protein ACI8ZN_001218 [Bacteroidia bacterium]|jgi:hypothetical protein